MAIVFPCSSVCLCPISAVVTKNEGWGWDEGDFIVCVCMCGRLDYSQFFTLCLALALQPLPVWAKYISLPHGCWAWPGDLVWPMNLDGGNRVEALNVLPWHSLVSWAVVTFSEKNRPWEMAGRREMWSHDEQSWTQPQPSASSVTHIPLSKKFACLPWKHAESREPDKRTNIACFHFCELSR